MEKKHKRIEYRKNFGTWLAFIALSTALVFSALTIYFIDAERGRYMTQLENLYKKSFYELSDNMNNLEIKLSKLIVSTSGAGTLRYLNDVSQQADSTEASLSALPITHDSVEKTSKFVNQLGDYCKGLSDKVAAGGKLSAKDAEQLDKMYDVSSDLRRELAVISAKVNDGYNFMGNRLSGDTGFDKLLSDSFGDVQNNTVEYPSLIYDGPFSDSLLGAEPKGLPQNEISEEDAAEVLKQLLSSAMEVESVEYQNTSEGKMVTYNFDVIANGGSMYAQITKLGGKLMLLDNPRDMGNFELEIEDCLDIAEDFVKELGIPDMKAVWQSDYHGFVYVNPAPEISGTLYYPDLIRVVVARDNGDIIGYEARGYYSNHTQRELPAPACSKLQARQQTFSSLKITSERLALIPRPDGTETLAWEFFGTHKNLQYFVYVDAATCEEIDVLRVVDSDEGSLVV